MCQCEGERERNQKRLKHTLTRNRRPRSTHIQYSLLVHNKKAQKYLRYLICFFYVVRLARVKFAQLITIYIDVVIVSYLFLDILNMKRNVHLNCAPIMFTHIFANTEYMPLFALRDVGAKFIKIKIFRHIETLEFIK